MKKDVVVLIGVNKMGVVPPQSYRRAALATALKRMKDPTAEIRFEISGLKHASRVNKSDMNYDVCALCLEDIAEVEITSSWAGDTVNNLANEIVRKAKDFLGVL